MLPTPQKYDLVAGFGEGATTLIAFDAALLHSGLGNLNLLKVSSILPPHAEFAPGLTIPPGSLVPTAYGTICSQKSGERIAAAVAVGIPKAPDSYGVIMECSGCCTREELEQRIREMVLEAFEKRDLPLKEIRVSAIEHVVKTCGCVFAGLPLWY